MIVIGRISPTHYLGDIRVIVPFGQHVEIPDDLASKSLHLAQALSRKFVEAIRLPPAVKPVPTHIPARSSTNEIKQLRKTIEAQSVTGRVDKLEEKVVGVDEKMDQVLGLVQQLLERGIPTSPVSHTRPTSVEGLPPVPHVYFDVDTSSVESERLVTQDSSDEGLVLTMRRNC